MARVEGILEEVRNRLNHLESELRELRREMRSNFLWTLGIMLGVLTPMWASLVSLIVVVILQI